jgi:hypothetical protein
VRYGTHYREGYLGFTQAAPSAPPSCIAFFKGWSRLSEIHVGHVFVVAGPTECVEVLPSKGVVLTPLARHLDDPRTAVCFRKPRKLSTDTGARIAALARAQAGIRVERLLKAAGTLDESFLHRWLGTAFRREDGGFLGRLTARDPGWMAAEFAAYCLDAQPEYVNCGILGKTDVRLSPQALFEDEELFASWKHEEPAKDRRREARASAPHQEEQAE